MGAQQQLGRHDVINLVASGLFGVALATILLLTIGAYSRLSADTDARLEQLGVTVNEKFTQEINGASGQLMKMVDGVSRDECARERISEPTPDDQRDPCQRLADDWSDTNYWSRKSETNGAQTGTSYSTYPDFIAFAMVNASGRQALKVVSRSTTPRTLVDVNGRAYYEHTRAHEQLWSLPPDPDSGGPAGSSLCPPDGCYYLEYVLSWSTGKPQVVLSMPTPIDRLPVATLAIPMHALLSPVLPPGFEFAVIDSAGLVQFHSDPQRNGVENLLLETDQNPRLRSLVAARSAGTFNTMYWGSPYRGYVRPSRIPGWSIVVLHDKQAARALVLEWFIVAMLLSGLY